MFVFMLTFYKKIVVSEIASLSENFKKKKKYMGKPLRQNGEGGEFWRNKWQKNKSEDWICSLWCIL